MNNWNQIKDRVDNTKFPTNVSDFNVTSLGEFHTDSKDSHYLDSYSKETNFNGFSIVARYNFCNKCKKCMWKTITAYNNKDGLAYQKVFTEKGVDKIL